MELDISAWVLLFLIISIISCLVFWLWSLVDCLKKKRFKNKLFWIFVLILLNFIGSTLYVLLVKKSERKNERD